MTKRAPAGAPGVGSSPPAPSEIPPSKKSPTSPSSGSGPTLPSATPPTQTAPRRSRAFLIFAAVLVVAWMAALGLLAHFTANPVMLNREQILASPFVVTGTVSGDPASGRVTVEREWKKQALSGTITVENLVATAARAGVTYVIPLSRPDEALRVTEAPYSNGAHLIYPATPDALNQLRAILDYQASLRNQP